MKPNGKPNERTGRHFTVAVFVVHDGKVLLHHHRKLDMWLPLGGHIEDDELPDDAAVREVYEEAGIEIELVGERRDDIEEPKQLHRPAGVQLEYIAEGHYHIDLIYFAKVRGDTTIHEENDGDRTGFYAPEEWDALGVNEEVRGWCEKALGEIR